MGEQLSRRQFLSAAGAAGAAGVFPGCATDDGEASRSTETSVGRITGTPSTTPIQTPPPTPTATATPISTATPTSGSLDVSGHVRPDTDPQTVPEELVCDDEAFERRSGWIEADGLHWGTVTDESGQPAFALRVDSLSVERGETVTFTLTNVSSENRDTANVYKANFDLFTDAGWQDPRGWESGRELPITDDVWEFEPGESFSVTAHMTAEGIVQAAFPPNQDELITCPALPAGRYRFATAAPEYGDLGVSFDLAR